MANKKNKRKRIIKGRDYRENRHTDGLRKSKAVGYRFKGEHNYKRPTQKDIEQHLEDIKNGKESKIYYENRVERSDKRGFAKRGMRYVKGGLFPDAIAERKKFIIWKGKSDSKREIIGESDSYKVANNLLNKKEKSGEFQNYDSWGIDDTKDSFFLKSQYEKYSDGGGVWTSEQKEKVAALDSDFEKAVKEKGIDPNSKEASDFWRSGGFKKRMAEIFGKTEFAKGGGVKEKEETVYIEYLNKKKNYQKDKKTFTSNDAYNDAVKWGRKNLENFNYDMIGYQHETGGLVITDDWGNDGSTASNNKDYNDLYAMFPDNHKGAKAIWNKLSEKQKDGFINDLQVTDAASEHIADSWLEFINAKSEKDWLKNATNWDEMKDGGSVKQKNFTGYVGEEVSIPTLELALGRKLHWWDDDVVALDGVKYKKCYMRPYYKQI